MTNFESREIENTQGPKIILAGSGMSIGGRVISHERNYLPDPKNTILLVGYQSAGSLGRELADGARKVKIYRDTIKVKAKIEVLYGYSAHKDSDRLLDFVGTGEKLKRVFVVMGEPRSSMYLAQRINDEFNIKAVAPEAGDVVTLE
jgi:metallo-beta-lactamase family protein